MRKLFSIAIIIFYSIKASALDLNIGALCNGESSSQSAEEINAAAIITEYFTAQGENLYECLGWLNLKGDNEWLFVNGDLNIHGFNFDTINHIGSWPLTTYPHRIKMKGEGISWKVRPELSAVYGGDYVKITDPEAQEFDPAPEYVLNQNWNSLGCYNQTPLRYGDINTDGAQELVLFLYNDFVVFSPETQKITFSAKLFTNDEIDIEASDDLFIGRSDNNVQLAAESGSNVLIKKPFPATRSFAKMYFDDINGDEKHDIIVWRKLYESRLKTDPVPGFQKVGDLYVHYSFIDGEYKLQTTEQADIKTWLDEKQLTWQKGYPSQSECAGQENQLIPEMHDPLLNDADVLH